VQPDGRIQSPADFRGRRIGTPQLGNTQDVACRAWLREHGFQVTTTGGDVLVVPTANPDQLLLFRKGNLDAVWTVEPWVSRLEREAGGRIFLEQDDALTTLLAASARTLATRRDLARRFVEVHRELTAWIVANPDSAQAIVRDELSTEMQGAVSGELVAHAWPRLRFTADIALEEFREFTADAQEAGFLPAAADIARLVEIP
jgi:NitT/TauT family transport system substrate-binding protein